MQPLNLFWLHLVLQPQSLRLVLPSCACPIGSPLRKRQIKDGYFLDRLLGIIPLFKEAFSWNQSSLQSISVSISP
ncbi:hypothetical protein, partial [Allobaculum fili]|uniref:hypothetical protein n=1 Tax=Allobaculum fili TaxID=2834460 RepID=UPI001E3414C0